MENQKEEEKKKNHKGLLILLNVILIVLVCACGVLIYLLLDDDPQVGGVGLVVDKNAGEFVAPETESQSQKGVSIPGWGTITMPANTKDITVDFYNPDANEGLYYLTFELSLAGGEVLYTSDLVEPGKHIQNITLSKGLAPGEYEAVIHVQPYKMNEEKTPTNNADMKTKLVVK